MTKFVKKITKGDKLHINSVVVGSAFDNLEDICEVYKTVFILLSSGQTFRRKNVVYRENFDDISMISAITSVFIDIEQLEKVTLIESVITKFKPLIYIGHGYHIDSYYRKFFVSRGYEVIEMHKTYQVWKSKK